MMEQGTQAGLPNDTGRSRTASAALLFNPFDPRVNLDPYPYYRRLRAEDPVHWSKLGAWFISGYDDVRSILRDRRLRGRDLNALLKKRVGIIASDACPHLQQGGIDVLVKSSSAWLPFQEAEEHRRLRSAYTGFLSRNYIEALRPYIRETARELLQKGLREGRIDMMNDFARRLSAGVIVKVVGGGDDVPRLMRRLSRRANQFLLSYTSLQDHIDLDKDVAEFNAYLEQQARRCRGSEAGTMIDSLFDTDNPKVADLTESDKITICLFMFVAGIEAVENLIGNGVLSLIHNPEKQAEIRNNRQCSSHMTDEFARYNSPLQSVMRVALEDIEVGGKTIRAGDTVYLLLGSANRDPAQFDRADELVLDRRPNKHLSFGDGHHLCIGAPLTRVQGEEAFSVVTEMMSDIRLACDELHWGRSLMARGLRELPVTFTAN